MIREPIRLQEIQYPVFGNLVKYFLPPSIANLVESSLNSVMPIIAQVLETLKKPNSVVNVNQLAGRAYHKLSGVYRRQKKLGAAECCVQLGEQALQTQAVNQDSSFLAYEGATVMLLFMADQPERSPAQVYFYTGSASRA